MGVLSRVIDGNVGHVLKAEQEHMEGLDAEERGAYRPTRFWLKPPTPSAAALLQDRLLGAAVYQGSLAAVEEHLERIEGLRLRDGSRVDLDRRPGTRLVEHLHMSWVLELAQELAKLADPDDEDFG